MNPQRSNTLANNLTTLLLTIYSVVIFWIIVLKLNISFSYKGTQNINLIPFQEPLMHNGRIDYNEMILNVLIFVPLGLYIGILFQKLTNAYKILLFFLVSFICEILQYILKIGAFDITDIINNTLGGIIGLVFFTSTTHLLKSPTKTQKFINLLAIICTILIVSTLLYLKVNKLLMFRR